SGFASLAPSATGSARPWIAWNPYVDRKCGRLLEQPMPETTRMFHGSSWSAWTAVWRARNTAKSPHPGHQVGLISDLYVSISYAVFCLKKKNAYIKAHPYDVAVLPFGATEPHNLHLPYYTDIYEGTTAVANICEPS